MTAVTEKTNIPTIPKETLIQECEFVEGYVKLAHISLIAITAIGFLTIYLGAPVVGVILISPGICGSLLSSDVKNIAQFLKTQEPYDIFANRNVLGKKLNAQDLAIITKQHCDLANIVLVTQSPIGKVLIDIYKESLQGCLKFEVADEETTILSCAKNEFEKEVKIPNPDTMRTSMEHCSRIISDIAVLVIGLSVAILAVASFSLYQFYPLSSLFYIPCVMSAITAVGASLVGLTLGYDIKRFSINIRHFQETDALKNLMQESAGWKLVGLSKAIGYDNLGEDLENLEITKVEIQKEVDQSAADAIQLFKDHLLKRLSPLGKKIITTVASKMSHKKELRHQYIMARNFKKKKLAFYNELIKDFNEKEKSLSESETAAALEQIEKANEEHDIAAKAYDAAFQALTSK